MAVSNSFFSLHLVSSGLPAAQFQFFCSNSIFYFGGGDGGQTSVHLPTVYPQPHHEHNAEAGEVWGLKTIRQ